MRALIQRVTRASVVVNGGEPRSIGGGYVILLGVGEADTEAETEADAETETETAVNVLDLLNGNSVPTHNPFAPKANSQFEGIPLLNVTPF